MENRIVIIDGNSLINRAYYAMQRPMITKDGIYTQGIYGFINMLNKNMDYETISEISGKTIEEIKEIENDINSL